MKSWSHQVISELKSGASSQFLFILLYCSTEHSAFFSSSTKWYYRRDITEIESRVRTGRIASRYRVAPLRLKYIMSLQIFSVGWQMYKSTHASSAIISLSFVFVSNCRYCRGMHPRLHSRSLHAMCTRLVYVLLLGFGCCSLVELSACELEVAKRWCCIIAVDDERTVSIHCEDVSSSRRSLCSMFNLYYHRNAFLKLVPNHTFVYLHTYIYIRMYL